MPAFTNPIALQDRNVLIQVIRSRNTIYEIYHDVDIRT